MAQIYFPFDSGAGANIMEDYWRKMAQHWLTTGIIKDYLNNLLTYADSSGMQVKVKTGAAWLKGHYFESDGEEFLPISTANATNPRIDRVIIRGDWTSNTILLAVLQGTPAVSPVAPALTQNSSRWEISLAQIRVNAAVSTISSGNVTDERNFVKNANAIQESWITATLQNGAYHEITGDNSGFVYCKNSLDDAKLKIAVGTPTAVPGTVIANLPAGYRPLKNEYILGSYNTTGNDYVTVLCVLTPTGDFKIFGNGGIAGGTLLVQTHSYKADL